MPLITCPINVKHISKVDLISNLKQMVRFQLHNQPLIGICTFVIVNEQQQSMITVTYDISLMFLINRFFILICCRYQGLEKFFLGKFHTEVIFYLSLERQLSVHQVEEQGKDILALRNTMNKGSELGKTCGEPKRW